MSALSRFRPVPSFLLILLVLLAPVRLFAVSCTMQSQMTDEQRNALVESSRKIALQVQAGNAAAVRALTVSTVAAHFDPIVKSIQETAPLIAGASITIEAVYLLDASDLKTAQNLTQFFCAGATPSLHEEIDIPQLPPGKYALSLVHATGVRKPQQMALLLVDQGGWQLAGFFAKPMLVAGHDSVWYWERARSFAQKGQKWNAHFYYEIAAYLAAPVDFLNTPNGEKLENERKAVQAQGLPGAQPLNLTADGQTFSITDLHTDASLGGLDLVVHYTSADASDPVATRTRNLQVMKALLHHYPELRDAFHGLWVFADAPAQRPFGIEQPMSDIPQS